MRRHAVIWMALGLLSLVQTLSAQSSSSKTTAPQPTAGELALLATTPKPGFSSAVRAALMRDDGTVRLTAARLAAVAGLSELEPDIVRALDHEPDETVAGEFVHTLLCFGTSSASAALASRFVRTDAAGADAYLLWLARTDGSAFDREFLRLTSDSKKESVMRSGVLLAAHQRPADRVHLLRMARDHMGANPWRWLLSEWAPSASDEESAIVIEALGSADADTREGTVWSVVTWIGNGVDLPAAIADAVTTINGPAAPSWETFGRELIARHLGHVAPTDRSDLIRRDGPRAKRGAPPQAWPVADLTIDERAALRDLVGGALDRIGTTDPAGQGVTAISLPTLRTPVEWPGLLASVLQASKCPPTKDQRCGTVRVEFRPNGLPAHVGYSLLTLPKSCEAALGALGLLTVAPATAVIGSTSQQLVLLPLQSDYVACTLPVRAKARTERIDDRAPDNGPIRQPKKTQSVSPIYPQDARDSKTQGVVLVEATISQTGCVRDGVVTRGVTPSMDFSALSAVLQWRYSPTKLDGDPAEVVISVRIQFVLQ